VSVVVKRGGISPPAQTVQLAAIAPGIFTLQYGSGQAVAVNQDGSLAAPANSVPGVETHPAAPGDVLTVYANGLGPVAPAIGDGLDSSDQLRTAPPTIVFIGGVPAQVLFAGLTPQFVGVNRSTWLSHRVSRRPTRRPS
jgi:uncharacterized protein (TIGR03437 family)